MGAAAISTNAGSTLILTDSGLAFLHSMRPFIDGVTLIMWAWGTWWIPLLILFGIWKHGVCRVPITYTPMLWSLVFPLGMYALASLRLSLASDFPPLHSISLAMVWVALSCLGGGERRARRGAGVAGRFGAYSSADGSCRTDHRDRRMRPTRRAGTARGISVGMRAASFLSRSVGRETPVSDDSVVSVDDPCLPAHACIGRFEVTRVVLAAASSPCEWSGPIEHVR